MIQTTKALREQAQQQQAVQQKQMAQGGVEFAKDMAKQAEEATKE